MHHKTIILLSFIMLLTVRQVVAQSSLPVYEQPRRLAIKLAPLSRLDPDATFQGALELSTGTKTSVQVEVGYGSPAMQSIGHGPAPWTSNGYVSGKEVRRVRLEQRFYRRRITTLINDAFWITRLTGSYFAIEGMYKRINVAQLDTIQGGETSPRAFVDAPVVRSAYGLSGKIGYQFPLRSRPGSLFSHIIIDLYCGVGIRYERVDALNDTARQLFASKPIRDRFKDNRFEIGQTAWGLTLPLGFKFGVSL